jgi:ssDNA-binding Zn-finger/Zn-ribbon topoisomerase 1
MDGYCVKCKETKEMKDPKETTTSNGRKMAKGTCPKCGTTMTKFLKG